MQPDHTKAVDVINLIYGLSKSVVLYEPNNKIVKRQISMLFKALSEWFASSGDMPLSIYLLAEEFFVNGVLMKVSPAFYERASELAGFLQKLDLGSFVFSSNVKIQDLVYFVNDLALTVRTGISHIGHSSYQGLTVGPSKGHSIASYRFKPDRLAILMCGSLLDHIEDLYLGRTSNLLSLKRALQLVIDGAQSYSAMFQLVAMIRDPMVPISNSRLRLAITIDAICFCHFLTLPKTDIMYLALASVLGGLSRSVIPEDAIRPMLKYTGVQEAAIPMVLAALDARNIRRGGPGGVSGQIIGICEIYHELTSRFRNRDPYSPKEALDLMAGEAFKGVAKGTLKIFADFKGPWPLGSVVRLNSSDLGLVISQTRAKNGQVYPIVILFDGHRLVGQPINIAEHPSLKVMDSPAAVSLGINIART